MISGEKRIILQPQNTKHKMRLDMNWVILIIAGLCETGFAFCLGKMKGLTGLEHWLWGAGFLLFLTASMLLLAKAVQTIPIGTAYPVWTGIGAVGTVVVGCRDNLLSRAGHIRPHLLHLHAHRIHCRPENVLIQLIFQFLQLLHIPYSAFKNSLSNMERISSWATASSSI